MGASAVHMVPDQGTPLMLYGWCTPIGLAGLAEVVRVLLPGGSSLGANAELQAAFSTLRLVQALFFSAPLLYLQLWLMMRLGLTRTTHHHATLIASAAIAFASLVVALTAFVTSPVVSRACRVRGWLLSSRVVTIGCSLYFASDITLRALAISTLGSAAGPYSLVLPSLLLFAWIRASYGQPLRVWLDTALRYFGYAMAAPILDGLGADPAGMLLESLLSTALCMACVLAGLLPVMPHPQHDPAVARGALVTLSASLVLKVATLLWCVFPGMTGRYPVLCVSRCECLTWRAEDDAMAERTRAGTRNFMEQRGGSCTSARAQY